MFLYQDLITYKSVGKSGSARAAHTMPTPKSLRLFGDPGMALQVSKRFSARNDAKPVELAKRRRLFAKSEAIHKRQVSLPFMLCIFYCEFVISFLKLLGLSHDLPHGIRSLFRQSVKATLGRLVLFEEALKLT